MTFMAAQPWFSSSNYELLRVIFLRIPHSAHVDNFFEAFLLNPLLSTWVFAACSYRFWTKEDEQRPRRRRYLVSAVLACGIAGLVTVILRPWIHWPAPVLNPNFQPLFPGYLWGSGNENCFPSHSTLAYFTIAAGFWPLHRRLSLCLAAMSLLFISFPRVYEGGHYPIDVLFSCLLGIVVLVVLWRWPVLVRMSAWPAERKLSGGIFRDLIFFLWVFELGEGFRGIELLFNAARHIL